MPDDAARPEKNDEQTELYKKLDEMLDEGVKHHEPLVAETELNLAFLSGNQWVKYVSGSGVVPISNANREYRVTDNKMLPVYRWRQARLFQARPVITAFEGGRELADTERALVASKLCDYFRSVGGWESAEKKASAWVDAAGVAFIAPEWRANRSRVEKVVEYTLRDEPYKTEDGISWLEGKESTRFGQDVTFDVYNILQTFLFPTTASDWKNINSILTVDLVNKSWLEENLPSGAEFSDMDIQPVKPERFNLDALDRANQFISSEMPRMPLGTSSGARYMLMIWRQRPTVQHPSGRYVVAVGNRIIIDAALPYVDEAREVDPNDELNLTMGMVPWFAYDSPGRLIPQAPMSLLRERQIHINELRTDERANRKTVGRNKIITEHGKIDRNAYTTEHGEIIEVHPGSTSEPKLIQGKPLVGLPNELEREMRAFNDAAGRNSLFDGHNPPQVRSAFHLDILREEASVLINDDSAVRERFHEQTARLVLAMVRRKMKIERIRDICGGDIAGFAVEFSNGNISTDIRVKEGSARARNHAVIEAKLIELLRYGAFKTDDGKTNMNLYWQMTELGTLNRAIDHSEKHRIRARAENAMMLYKSEAVIPENHEDHTLHMEEHVAYMARPEYYSAKESVKAVFMAHVSLTVNNLLQQFAPEALAEQFPPGLIEELAESRSGPPAAAERPGSGQALGGDMMNQPISMGQSAGLPPGAPGFPQM